MSEEQSAPATNLRGPPTLGPKRAVFAFIVYISVQLVVGVAIGLLGGLFLALGSGMEDPDAIAAALQQLVVPISFCIVIAGGVAVFVLTRRCFPGPIQSGALETVGWNGTRSNALLWAFLAGSGLAVFYVFGLIPAAPPVADQQFGPLANAAVAGGWQRHGWAMLVLLVAPAVEEFVFRGVILAGFRRSWSTGSAGALVVLLFWVMHLSEMQGYGPALVAVALVGAATVVARVTSGSLLPPIVLHTSYNLVIVVAAYSGAA